MIHLVDGPAKGTYACHRAPLFLRAVVHREHARADVLDQQSDKPLPAETVSVYKRTTEVSWVHLNMGGLRRGTGMYPMADYEHLPDVDGETLRDNAAWQEWAQAQP